MILKACSRLVCSYDDAQDVLLGILLERSDRLQPWCLYTTKNVSFSEIVASTKIHFNSLIWNEAPAR